MPFSIVEAVDEHVAALEEPRLPDGKWHPSSIYSCPRQSVYQLRGVPVSDDKDFRSRRILRLGTSLHEFVQDAVERTVGHTSRAVYNEIPVRHEELGISGTGDILVETAEGRWLLVEIKSIGVQAARYRDLPKSEHVGQWSAYALALRDYGSPERDVPPLGDALTHGLIVYVVKDTMEVQEHTVLWSDAKEVELRARVNYLEQHREGDLPPRLPLEETKTGLQRNWLCRGYCDFRTRCWEVDGDTDMRQELSQAA